MSIIPFDDRDGVIWYDGKLMPWRDAKLHVLSHGLHYGSCVFEGERSYAGRIFKMEEHHDRLIASGKLLGFNVPYSRQEIDAAAMAVLEAVVERLAIAEGASPVDRAKQVILTALATAPQGLTKTQLRELDQPGAPKPKLANEKPQGITVDYDELIKRWQKK